MYYFCFKEPKQRYYPFFRTGKILHVHNEYRILLFCDLIHAVKILLLHEYARENFSHVSF